MSFSNSFPTCRFTWRQGRDDNGRGEEKRRHKGETHNVKGITSIIAGHLHRTILSHWEHLPVVVCPSTAPAVGLDLTPMDPERPDERKLITDEPPGYCLHVWNGKDVVTHFEYAGDYRTLARFDSGLQGMIREMFGERPRG